MYVYLELESGVNWVIDIGEFSTILNDVLSKYNFNNLNELFPTENTTTEFMCKTIYEDIKSKLKSKSSLCKGILCVKLHESHKAWASYSKNMDL